MSAGAAYVPPHGSLDALREEAIEQLRLCSWHTSLAADQGLATADAGMVYNTKRAFAHLRMVGDVLKMMHEHRQAARLRIAETEGADVALGMEKPRTRP